MGSRTLGALNACPAAALMETLCNLSTIFYSELAAKRPADKRNLEGWLKRAAAVPPGIALRSPQSARSQQSEANMRAASEGVA
jgi:lysozyme family protein